MEALKYFTIMTKNKIFWEFRGSLDALLTDFNDLILYKILESTNEELLQFNEEPLEYFIDDIYSNNSLTKRHCVIELISCLCSSKFCTKVVPVFVNLVVDLINVISQ